MKLLKSITTPAKTDIEKPSYLPHGKTVGQRASLPFGVANPLAFYNCANDGDQGQGQSSALAMALRPLIRRFDVHEEKLEAFLTNN